jgi:hypothetical protein
VKGGREGKRGFREGQENGGKAEGEEGNVSAMAEPAYPISVAASEIDY